jgi:hypothetical protein
MPPASNKRRVLSRAGAPVWLLVAGLLLAQLLGLMHGVVHSPQAPVHSQSHAHHDGHQHQQEHSALAHAEEQVDGGWLASLFSSHDGDSDCRLFDQASHAQVVPAFPMLSLPLILSSVAFDISRGEALARWAALFDARGPPSTR